MEEHFLRRDETLEEANRGGGAGLSRPTGFQPLESETARPLVFCRNVLQDTERIGISALGQEELGRLLEADDGDSENGEHKDERSRSVPDVAPSLVVVPSTISGILTGVIREKSPGKQSGNQLAQTCRK